MTGRPNPTVGPRRKYRQGWSYSILVPWPVARPPDRSNRRSRLVGATKPSGRQNLRSRLVGSKKLPTPRHLQHPTFHRCSSLGCATVLQSKPITAFSNDQSHYHPKPTSHHKKKHSHASKPAHSGTTRPSKSANQNLNSTPPWKKGKSISPMWMSHRKSGQTKSSLPYTTIPGWRLPVNFLRKAALNHWRWLMRLDSRR